MKGSIMTKKKKKQDVVPKKSKDAVEIPNRLMSQEEMASLAGIAYSAARYHIIKNDIPHISKIGRLYLYSPYVCAFLIETVADEKISLERAKIRVDGIRKHTEEQIKLKQNSNLSASPFDLGEAE